MFIHFACSFPLPVPDINAVLLAVESNVRLPLLDSVPDVGVTTPVICIAPLRLTSPAKVKLLRLIAGKVNVALGVKVRLTVEPAVMDVIATAPSVNDTVPVNVIASIVVVGTAVIETVPLSITTLSVVALPG